ncbi:MAG: ABC transporter permease, partial [Mycobacterium sp.]|nr:ABC transporter permease [Mycobacterium sp.]
WIAAVIFALTVWLLSRTRFGRHTYAVGSDPLAASRAGIDVRTHTLKIYVLSGAMYGLVAWLNLSRFSASNLAGHADDGLNAITAVVLGGASLFGGVGSALGSLIGVFIPAVLRNGLVILAVQPFWQLIAIGAALAVAVSVDQHRRRKNSHHNDLF